MEEVTLQIIELSRVEGNYNVEPVHIDLKIIMQVQTKIIMQ
jgi:hypothetical protein